MASIKWEAAAITSLLTTELNSLTNGSSSALGTEYDNSSNLYIYGFFELNCTWGTNPTANSLCNLYLVTAPDGTNYDDGSSSVTPALTTYVGGFPVRAVTTAQKISLGGPGVPSLIPLPPLKFKVLLINNVGQTTAASGNTVKLVPYRFQVV